VLHGNNLEPLMSQWVMNRRAGESCRDRSYPNSCRRYAWLGRPFRARNRLPRCNSFV
jgi:hypothetical protein